MNVLVYSGSEVNQKYLNATVGLLRSVCLPNYTVQVLSKASFVKDRWEIACALFVLPNLSTGVSTSDLEVFGPREVQRIREYVEQGGGAFLGLGLGARLEEHGSLDTFMRNLDFGNDLYIKDEDRRVPLEFLDANTKTYIYPVTGMVVESEPVNATGKEGESVTIQTTAATFPGAEGQPKNFDVLATAPSGPIAGHMSVGKGNVALARVHLECEDESLHPLLRSILSSLNLQLPSTPLYTSSSDLTSLPQFLTSIPPHGEEQAKPIVSLILSPFFSDLSGSSFLSGSIKDTVDTFKFVSLKAECIKDLVENAQRTATPHLDEKHIIACFDGALPPKKYTPRFDLQLYYDTLRKLKGFESSLQNPDGWGFGEALLYSERVTSTQSMFDKNPKLLSTMPTPVLSIASQQLEGRGRGRNVWLSPEGGLMMSLIVRVSLDPGGPSNTAKTAKTQAAKPSAFYATAGAKTAKTSEVDQPAKTTKTENIGASSKTSSSGMKTTKPARATSGSADIDFKSAPAASVDALKTAMATSSTSENLKNNPICPEISKNKTNKTNISSVPESTKTTGVHTTKTAATKITASGTSSSPAASLKSSNRDAALTLACEPHQRAVSSNPIPVLSASKLVFIQYLFALAVCEACRLPEVLGPELGKRVRIKWPNDIYLDLSDPRGTKNLKKIGGILVNANFGPGAKVDVVIGCGLNVLNAPPISSLAQLVSELRAATSACPALSLERTAAAIMTTFEGLWEQFTASHGSFEPFLSSYYDVWLHSDQRVTVTTIVPPIKARIVGITPDYGLLRTVRDEGDSWSGASYGRYVYSAYEGGRDYVDLQPDGNSFDLMANLIKTKTA